MKQNQIKHSIAVLIMVCFCCNVFAQQANTLYFMQGIPERNAYNPAFQSPYDFYIDLPVMPNFRFGFENNSLVFNDIIFSKNIDGRDSTMTFLHPLAMKERENFFKSLRNTTHINAGLTVNLLGFGFRNGKNYFTFDISQKGDVGVYLPKDLFKLLLYGTGESGKFDLNKLGVNASIYTEVGVGYSRRINDKLTIGGKLKYLIGEANISTKTKKFEIDADIEKWRVDGSATVNGSFPAFVDTRKFFKDDPNDPTKEILDFSNISNAIGDINLNSLKIGNLFSNYGFGLDLGATYQLLPQLQLSAAITDLGFIRWSNNTVNTSITKDFTFEGIEYVVGDDENDIEDHLKNEFDKLKELFVNDNAKGAKGKAYTTSLSTRFNVGAEYGILNDKIGFGLLSSTLFANKSTFTDLTVSANFRPCYWFHPTISYSVLDGRFNTIGFGAQLKVGMFNMYMAIDKIPFSLTKNYIPKQITGTNAQFGMVWVFGDSRSWKNKDDDNDGVKNKKDKCPYTPVGFWVDTYGCPLDDDKDGVFNDIDRCPDTPAGALVDEWGCPVDTDGDGVPDYLDKCPGTPAEAYGLVDENGCPVDTDGDSVPDYLDKCPGTPAEAYGLVDENGCPVDTDGDGVPDYLDKCPGTPAEAYGLVDENGCPKDTDGDGMPDYLDECPTVKGTIENKGCPVVKEAVKKVFEKALQGIQFETGKSSIKKTSFPILNQIITIMKENPDYLLIINGHTDNVGKPDKNLILSEDRANSVQNYLIKGGIDPFRLTAKGYGDTQPVVENTTKANKAKNRRVEFIVKFEKFEQE
jgi:outer membrane protein OmpA-like peptidoglycan-associated protein